MQPIAVSRREFVGRLAGGAALAAPAILSGCHALPVSPLRVGAIVWPGFECLFLARSLGFFNDAPIKPVEYPSAPEAIRAFQNRAIDVVAVTGDEFLRLAVPEPSLKALLVTDFSQGADALIGRRDHGGVPALAGKKVGVEVNAVGVFLLMRALDAAGMKPDQIEIVPLDVDEQVAAFSSGAVDAVVAFEPNRARILKRGGQVLFDSSRIPGEIVDLLATREEVLQTRAGDIRALLDGWFAARERLLSGLDGVCGVAAEREGITVEEFKEALQLISIPSRAENAALLGKSESDLMRSLRKMHQVMRGWGKVQSAEPRQSLLAEGLFS